LKLEEKLRKDLDTTLNQIDTFWFQKSRAEQIQDRDRNTRFFHTSTLIRRHINRIEGLMNSEGVWCYDAEPVKRIVVTHFRTLFAPQEMELVPIHSLNGVFPRLTEKEKKHLAKNFTQEDIYEALRDMGPFRAPGPDSFQVVFF